MATKSLFKNSIFVSTHLVNFTECAIAQLADDSPVIFGIFVELHVLADLFAPQITGDRAAFKNFTDPIKNGRHCDGLVVAQISVTEERFGTRSKKVPFDGGETG